MSNGFFGGRTGSNMNTAEKVDREARAIRLNAGDNVIVAVDTIEKGRKAGGVAAGGRIPRGHKMAVEPIDAGKPIIKFGQIIGFAKAPIAPGEWVHEQNVEMAEFERDYAFARDARPSACLPLEARATFQGFRRANGKAATR